MSGTVEAIDRLFARYIEGVYADRDRDVRDEFGEPEVDPVTSGVMHLLDGLHHQVRAIVERAS